MTHISRTQALGFTAGLAVALGWSLARRARAFDFAGRVVLITGGSRGLGLELAREFAARGASLALVARSAEELAAAVIDLNASGASVFAWQGDLARRADVQAAVDAVLAHYGRVDVLVNNAGVVQVGPIRHMEVADYEASLAIHLWAPLHATNAVLPAMRRQGHGRIVNISSIGGKVSVPHLAPYCVGKFALTAFSDACRNELAADGIVVTTVCPGLMRTGSPGKAWVKGQHEAEFTWFMVSDSLPGLAIHSRRAARQIVQACAEGRAELVITPQARLAVLAQAIAPEAFAAAMTLAVRALPGPTVNGDEGRTGEASRPERLPDWVVAAGDEASYRNLECVEPARPPSTGDSPAPSAAIEPSTAP